MENINVITGVMACIFDSVIMLWCVTKILGEKREIRWWSLPFFVLLFFDGFLLEQYVILQATLVIGLLFLYERLFLKGNSLRQLIIALGCVVTITLINGLVLYSAAVVSGMDVAEIVRLQGVPRILIFIMDKVVLFVTYYLMERVIHVDRKMKLVQEIITVILYLAVFVNGIVSIAILTNPDTGGKRMGVLLVNVIQIGIAVAIHQLLKQLGRQQKLKEENDILSMQIYEQEYRLRQTEELYHATRKMRHDMKRYFTTYLELLEAGKTDMVIEELRQTLRTRLPEKQVVYTSNQVINAVINDKLCCCQEKDIVFDIQITNDIPDNSGMDDAIILSNLLDNAIEAEEKVQEVAKRKISLKIFCYKGMLNLIVRNYIQESVLERNPSLRTTKRNKWYHGLGIDSVREMVKGQKGELDFAEEDSYFVAHIMLPKNCQGGQ